MTTVPGIYRHYKGKHYRVIGVAHHSESLEKFVIYEALYHNEKFPQGTLWIRPESMFHEVLDINGHKIPRFECINYDDND